MKPDPVEKTGLAVAAGASPESTLPQSALDELEALRHQARSEGFECGRQEGEAASRTEYEAHIARLGDLLESVKRQRDDMLGDLEDDIAALAFEVATALIGDHAVERRVLQLRVEQVVAERVGMEPLAVRVAPEDVDAVTAALSHTHEGDAPGLRVLPDPSIVIGGCVIEFQSEQLDHRLGLQLGKLRDIFLNARAASSGRGAVIHDGDADRSVAKS